MKVQMRISIAYFFMILLLLVSVAACSKKNGGEGGGGAQLSGFERSRSLIPLTAVQGEGGCLNAPLSPMALRQLRPDLPLLEATTSFGLKAGDVRDAFRLLTAFGNFQYEQHSGSDSIDLQGWRQEGCKLLFHTASDGTEEEYRITESTGEYLLAESDSGARVSFRWLSDTRGELGSRHKVLDLPCSSASAMAELKQVFDWSGQLPATLDSSSPLYVEDGYLESLASAAGTNSADYYQPAPDNPAARVEITGKLMELAKATIRPELVTCTGATPSPTPPPEDSRDPAPPNPEDPEGPRPVFPGPLAVEAGWI